jgi:hypothetical protein
MAAPRGKIVKVSTYVGKVVGLKPALLYACVTSNFTAVRLQSAVLKFNILHE